MTLPAKALEQPDETAHPCRKGMKCNVEVDVADGRMAKLSGFAKAKNLNNVYSGLPRGQHRLSA